VLVFVLLQRNLISCWQGARDPECAAMMDEPKRKGRGRNKSM
jgi:hypothetical protein